MCCFAVIRRQHVFVCLHVISGLMLSRINRKLSQHCNFDGATAVSDAGLKLQQKSSKTAGLLQARARAGSWSPAQSASLVRLATAEVNCRCVACKHNNMSSIVLIYTVA